MSKAPLTASMHARAHEQPHQPTIAPIRYRRNMAVRLAAVTLFTVVDVVGFGLNAAWNYHIGFALGLIAVLLGVLLCVEALYRLLKGKIRGRCFVPFRNFVTFAFIVLTVIVIINIVVHLMANSYLDAWPPSCAFGLDKTLSLSARDGQRSCARVADAADSFSASDGAAQDTIAGLNVSLLPPVYRMTQAQALRALDNFLSWYTPLNQSTVLSNVTSDEAGSLLVARVLSAFWGFPDYLHLNATTCTNVSMLADGPATLIQIQSQQAFGYSDILVNARRVAAFLQSLERDYELIGNNRTCH